MTDRSDQRHHVQSLLMRESLVDRGIMESTEVPVVRMLPNAHVVKVGGRSILDAGRHIVPVRRCDRQVARIETADSRRRGRRAHASRLLDRHRSRASYRGTGATVGSGCNGNAHILGTLLAPLGVVAIPPEMFGHLLPFLVNAVPGVIFNGVPPYSLWEHPPVLGRIPPHRTDAGCFLLAECFGCKSLVLVKDVDGLYDKDPKERSDAAFIREISVAELEQRSLPTLPFDRVLLKLLRTARLLKQFQVINGHKPELLAPALNGEHVGTIVHVE